MRDQTVAGVMISGVLLIFSRPVCAGLHYLFLPTNKWKKQNRNVQSATQFLFPELSVEDYFSVIVFRVAVYVTCSIP